MLTPPEVRMVHDDDTSEPLHNVISDGDLAPAERPADLTDARYNYIKRIAIDEPSWGPRQIYEWIHEDPNRHDITRAMIYYVLKWERPARQPRLARPPVARRPGTNI
ncbi:hypothetical protein ACN27B_29080 [Micromonospora sp. WMMD754]|uniref:hypothetical protein n=1 Tax=Micromonospora sp. WMMD754 TaxID=3404114 RepID=UPI003BF5FE4F